VGTVLISAGVSYLYEPFDCERSRLKMDFEDDSPSAAEAFYTNCYRKKKNQPEGV
jgi:hypothetical protein